MRVVGDCLKNSASFTPVPRALRLFSDWLVSLNKRTGFQSFASLPQRNDVLQSCTKLTRSPATLTSLQKVNGDFDQWIFLSRQEDECLSILIIVFHVGKF